MGMAHKNESGYWEGIIEELIEREERTPDWSALVQFTRLPVMVYGAHMQDERFGTLLEDAEYLGRGVTCSSDFTMKQFGFRTAIAFDGKMAEKQLEATLQSPIMGEVYACSIEHLHSLDESLENGEQFVRNPYYVRMIDQNSMGSKTFNNDYTLKVYMHVGVPNYWRPLHTVNCSRVPDPTKENRRVFKWRGNAQYPSSSMGKETTSPENKVLWGPHGMGQGQDMMWGEDDDRVPWSM